MESSEAGEGEANDESNDKGGEGRGEERDDQADGGVPPDALAPLLLVHHQDPHLSQDVYGEGVVLAKITSSKLE